MRNIVIYGAGGYGKEVVCLINNINRAQEKWKVIGFIDDGLVVGATTEYGTILGGFDFLQNWEGQLDVVIAIGDPVILTKITEKLTNPNLLFPNIIAPDVIFLDKNLISLGYGNIIGFRNMFSNYVKIGNFNIFNTDIIIGHDSIIGNCNVFNPTIRVSGQVTIGNSNFFGVGSTVLQNKRIGNNTLISAGSVVMRNTIDNNSYFGNPAIKLKF